MVRVSAQEPDWSRERLRPFEWSPAKRLLRAIRAHQRWRARGPWTLPFRALAKFRWRFWSIIAGCEVPLTLHAGGGLMFPHPNGIVIHPDVHIGPNCMIFQQVTLGFGRGDGVPRIGGHVDIGAGAKILGNVTIGDHAKIGANAVVLCDVPANATAVGIPARILQPDFATASPD